MTKVPEFVFRDIPEGSIWQIPENGYGRIKPGIGHPIIRDRNGIRECYICSSFNGIKLFIAVMEWGGSNSKITRRKRWWIDGKDGRICDSFEYPE